MPIVLKKERKCFILIGIAQVLVGLIVAYYFDLRGVHNGLGNMRVFQVTISGMFSSSVEAGGMKGVVMCIYIYVNFSCMSSDGDRFGMMVLSIFEL